MSASPNAALDSASPRSPAAGLVLAIASAASFGVSGSFAKALMDSGWSAGAAVTVRLGGAALVLLVPTLFLLRGRWHLLRTEGRTLLTYGILGAAGVQWCYFNAVRHLPVGVALLIEYLSPLLVVVWMWVVTRIRPTRLTVLGSSVAIAGLVCVLDLAGAGQISIPGILWSLGAAVANAVYFITAARSSALPPLAMVGVGMTLGTIVIGLLGLVGVLPLVFTAAPTLVAGHTAHWLFSAAGMVLISTVLAYGFGIVAARALGPKVAAFLALTEVLFAVLAAWVLLAQWPTLMQCVGGVLIIAGVVCVRLGEVRSPAGPERGTATDAGADNGATSGNH